MFNKPTIREDVKEVVDETAIDTNRYSADILAPGIAVKNTSGDIKTKSSGNGLKNLDLKKAPRGTFKRTEFHNGEDSYQTYHYGLEVPIDMTEALENSDFFDEEVDAGVGAKSLLLVGREKRVADALFNSTTFAGVTNQVAVSNGVWTAAAAALWTDVNAAYLILKKKFPIRKMMLTLSLTEDVFSLVMRSTEVRADVKYTNDISSADESAQMRYLAAYLGIKNIVLTSSQLDSTAEGTKEASFADIWNPAFAMLMLVAPASNSWNTKGVARQPIWTKFATDYRMESYDEEASDSRIVRAREYRGEKINTKYGVLITGVSA